MDLTIRSVGDAVIYLGAIAAAVAAIAAVVRYVVVRPIRHKLDEHITRMLPPLERTRESTEQLRTNHGTHLADKVERAVEVSEQTLSVVTDLRADVDRALTQSSEAKQIALDALHVVAGREK